LIIIQLLQTLSMTFKDVKVLDAKVSFVISDQIVLKGCSITLFKQLHEILVLYEDIVFKIERQRINQLQSVTFSES